MLRNDAQSTVDVLWALTAAVLWCKAKSFAVLMQEYERAHSRGHENPNILFWQTKSCIQPRSEVRAACIACSILSSSSRVLRIVVQDQDEFELLKKMPKDVLKSVQPTNRPVVLVLIHLNKVLHFVTLKCSTTTFACRWAARGKAKSSLRSGHVDPHGGTSADYRHLMKVDSSSTMRCFVPSSLLR